MLKYKLFESYNVPLVVIDVQPEYHKFCKNITSKVVDLINNHKRVKVFYVGQDLSNDSEMDVIQYYLEYGLEENEIDKISFTNKLYGFFRSWMDLGADKSIIIKVLREMYQRRIYDSRDFDDLEEFIGNDYESWMEDDALFIPDININDLRSYNNCYIVGGGRSECLEELTILFNVFNIRYTIIKSLTY